MEVVDKEPTALTDPWQDIDISSDVGKDKPGRFLNRELSWLEFNRRVYEEAMNRSHPLLERLRFLSISASNLDEFYMVRVAGLKGQVASRVRGLNPDKLTPAQQLRAIAVKVNELAADQHACLELLLENLKKEGIRLVGPDDLSADDRRWLATMFRQNIFPILSPIAVDPAHPFPFIPNLGFALVLELEGEEGDENLVALVIMPAQLDRFIRLPGKKIRFIALEKVVLIFLDLLFPSFTLLSSGTFRVIRDSEMEIDEEAEDLVRTFESALKRRRRGNVVRLTVDDEVSSDLLYFIQAQLDVSKHDVFCFKGMIGLSDIRELVVDDRPSLLFPAYEPRFPERIRDYGGDCLAAIQAKDILVHHPYESFDVVVQFLRQASQDKDVVAIRQTLYRTSEDSPVVQALVEAAEAGKSVTAMIGHAKEGRPAGIWVKVNALVDPEIIDALYRASGAGVKIKIVARGICSLRPRVPGLSENIEVKSIVGRFLEHSRIACFGNGHELPSPKAKVYISSAEWMPRNIYRRIESLVTIDNPTVHQQVLDQIMVANFRDNEQSWMLQADGSYQRCTTQPELFNAHQFFMTYPSLSGRGSALSTGGRSKKKKKGKGKK